MKKILCVVFVISLIFSLASATSAKGGVLSPGLEVIAKRNVMIRSERVGHEISFKLEDIKNAVGISDIEQISIMSLPSSECGVLRFGTLDVFCRQQIGVGGIDKLCFYPSDNCRQAEFSYRVNDMQTETVCKMYWYEGENSAPTSSGLKLRGIKDIPLYSSFAVAEPDGDEYKIELVSQARHGLVSIDEQSGYFKYTPSSGYIGNDSFVYRAVDKYGLAGDVSTVSIKLECPSTDIVYSDMSGNIAQTASIHLAEKNILIGERIGDEAVFCPEKNVTRAEFLVMAMKACNYSPNVYKASLTSFSDDGKISSSHRPYVIAAEVMGIIKGSDKIAFRGDETITYGEAAVILSRLLEYKASTPVFSGGLTEAQLACKLLAEEGVACAMKLEENDKLNRMHTALLLDGVMPN